MSSTTRSAVVDVMIPNYHSAEDIELGNQIAGLELANAKRWGVIHETANHFDHIHIATDDGG